MTSTNSEEQTKKAENLPKTDDNEYEILPEDISNFDLSFKIIVTGDPGKINIYIIIWITNNRGGKIMFINSSNQT